MSTPVGNSAPAANYAASDAALQTESSGSSAGVDPAVAASVQAWEKEQQKEARDELQRGVFSNMGQSYAADDDDDDAKATKQGIKQGAHKAGVMVTDKGLHTMQQATQNDGGTRRLIDKLKDPNDADTQQLTADLQAGNTPNLAFMQQAFAQSPAAALPADATTPAQQDLLGQVNATADQLTATQKTLQSKIAASGVAGTNVEVPLQANANTTGTATAPAGDAATAATISAANSPTPLNTPGIVHLAGGNWNTYVAMAMYNSTKELQIEKKSELNQIKKFNAMLDAVNSYVSNTLMPAQQELQSRVAATKDKDKAANLEVTIYNPLRNIETSDCDQDPATGAAVLIQKPGTADPPVAQKVTQVSLTSMIGEADQWRTSISNNQQLHSSNYQSLDTQVTSNLNMITALFKNVNETQTGIVRNLPT